MGPSPSATDRVGTSTSRPATARSQAQDYRMSPGLFYTMAALALVGVITLGIIGVKAIWPDPTTCTNEHVVEQNDSWYRMADKYPSGNHGIYVTAGASAYLTYNERPANETLTIPLQPGQKVTLYCGGPLPEGFDQKVSTG